MDKNHKDLVDDQEGEFILNESGTSVSIDPVEGIDIPLENETQDNQEQVKQRNAAQEGKQEETI
jgi:hypothetical protein